MFKPFDFATDPRLRPIGVELMSRNWWFGGQPGSGKTFALRLLILAAALDVRCEIRGYELKGVGDFSERRSKRIAFYAAKGMCPENKVTPELASLKGVGVASAGVFRR